VERRTIATLDADLHALLALTQVRQPSVIRIRVEWLRAEEFSGLIQRVLRQCAEVLQRERWSR
jgi:predicted nuclease of predicted toxin-antitoxin system